MYSSKELTKVAVKETEMASEMVQESISISKQAMKLYYDDKVGQFPVLYPSFGTAQIIIYDIVG